MTHRYTIGGVAFCVDELLPDLEMNGFADDELRVRVLDDAAFRSLDAPRLRRVDGQEGLTGATDPDSRTCWLPNVYESSVARSWQLRHMAPVFSSVLGRLVLHAGAAVFGESIIGFVAEGGTGKSTLAGFLSDRGYRAVADDLLPIRIDPEPSAPAGGRLLPVGAICFLSRAAVDTVTVEPLTTMEALQSLIRNGFGDHGDRPTWSFQFDAYHRLAHLIPFFSLTIPDDLAALPRVEDALVHLAERQRRVLDSGGG